MAETYKGLGPPKTGLGHLLLVLLDPELVSSREVACGSDMSQMRPPVDWAK